VYGGFELKLSKTNEQSSADREQQFQLFYSLFEAYSTVFSL